MMKEHTWICGTWKMCAEEKETYDFLNLGGHSFFATKMATFCLVIKSENF